MADKKHYVATYNGKSVTIDYVPDPKREFNIVHARAGQRARGRDRLRRHARR